MRDMSVALSTKLPVHVILPARPVKNKVVSVKDKQGREHTHIHTIQSVNMDNMYDAAKLISQRDVYRSDPFAFARAYNLLERGVYTITELLHGVVVETISI